MRTWACVLVLTALMGTASGQTPGPPGQIPPTPQPRLETTKELQQPAPLVDVLSRFSLTLYGFIEFDSAVDTTQSFTDFPGNTAVARPGTYAGDHGRVTFGVRNSRFGIKIKGPSTEKVKTSAQAEMDFLGNQPPNATEAAFFTNPTFRIRHMNLKIETAYVDILLGQYWQLFGWQSYFHPNTVEIQGVPGQVYSRSPQIRLSHAFKIDPLTVEVAAAAARPPERDSDTPDGQGGIKVSVNKWKALHTMGAAGTQVDSAAFGASAVVRRFDVPEFTAKPVNDVSTTGWGVSLDVLIPVVPATLEHKANALTITGSYVNGSGTADLYSQLSGGIGFPNLPNPMNTMPAPTYTPDVDNGLVTFSSTGHLETIDWWSFIAGVQYYLPPSGAVFLSANYSQMHSNNIAALGNPKSVFKDTHWLDGNLFWDVNAAVRLGFEFAWFDQTDGDGTDASNDRVQFSAWFIF